MPPGWDALSKALFGHAAFGNFLHGEDHYAPQPDELFCQLPSAHGVPQGLPRLQAIFSLGAGVDGFLRDRNFPAICRWCASSTRRCSGRMAQYYPMHALIIHRQQRPFDAAQKNLPGSNACWRRPSREVRIGILRDGRYRRGDGGTSADVRFPGVRLQSRSRKDVPSVTSFAGKEELRIPGPDCDIMVCMLPLTPETENILNAQLFAGLPQAPG